MRRTSTAGAARGQDVQNGRGRAQLWCSDCHLVDPREQKTGRSSAVVCYPKKAIEKTILRFLGSRTFSGLHPLRTLSQLVVGRCANRGAKAAAKSHCRIPHAGGGSALAAIT